MDNRYCDDSWHALFVVTGEEDNVKERIKYTFGEAFNVFVPKRKLRERKAGTWIYNTRVLFPGYVLLNGDIDVNSYYGLKGVPGLIRLLRSEHDILKIDYSEIKVLSRLIFNNEVIGLSDVLLESGTVKVMDGPLVSMEGIIASIDHRKGRAKVRLSFLGEERLVELGISVLRPV
jgi:transcriptional antiterminator NusG